MELHAPYNRSSYDDHKATVASPSIPQPREERVPTAQFRTKQTRDTDSEDAGILPLVGDSPTSFPPSSDCLSLGASRLTKPGKALTIVSH